MWSDRRECGWSRRWCQRIFRTDILQCVSAPRRDASHERFRGTGPIGCGRSGSNTAFLSQIRPVRLSRTVSVSTVSKYDVPRRRRLCQQHDLRGRRHVDGGHRHIDERRWCGCRSTAEVSVARASPMALITCMACLREQHDLLRGWKYPERRPRGGRSAGAHKCIRMNADHRGARCLRPEYYRTWSCDREAPNLHSGRDRYRTIIPLHRPDARCARRARPSSRNAHRGS